MAQNCRIARGEGGNITTTTTAKKYPPFQYCLSRHIVWNVQFISSNLFFQKDMVGHQGEKAKIPWHGINTSVRFGSFQTIEYSEEVVCKAILSYRLAIDANSFSYFNQMWRTVDGIGNTCHKYVWEQFTQAYFGMLFFFFLHKIMQFCETLGEKLCNFKA